MGNILILNGSPRAPRSNSKAYAQLFQNYCSVPTKYREIQKNNHQDLSGLLAAFSDLLLVFPLYADGIPVTLLRFLKHLEENPPAQKPTVSLLINCGFLEPEQNDVAVDMIRFFCKTQGYSFGAVLRIGSGEAILGTPLRGIASRKIKRLASAVSLGKSADLKATMPLPKKLFVLASSKYWESMGKNNGVTREQMASMEIEAP